MLSSDSVPTTISNLAIVKEKDLTTQKIYYAILGETLGDSAKVACRIVLNNDKFYFEKSEISTSVICFGSENCHPKMSNSKWVCDDGTGRALCSKDCIR